MKVLLIHNKFLPIYNTDNRGAIEQLVKKYLEKNEIYGDDITVYSPKISETEYDKKPLKKTSFRNVDLTSSTAILCIEKILFALYYRIRRMRYNPRYIFKVIRDLKRRKEQNYYDIIIFENCEKEIPLFKRLTRTKTKIVLHLHNDYINVKRSDSRAIIKACDEIWTVSDFLSRRINDVQKTKTKTISNTISINKNIVNRESLLHKKYKSKNDKVFLYVGRLLNDKGVPQLLEAFDRYSSIEKNSKLIIIGSAESGKRGDEIRKILEKYIAKNDRICAVGYVRPNELVEYHRIADCQIVPSICEEAFGLVILEAMASNLKIIASRSGGIPEIGGNLISYVNCNNIVEELITEMKKIDKNELPENYYSFILKRYSEENYYRAFWGAIHEK